MRQLVDAQLEVTKGRGHQPGGLGFDLSQECRERIIEATREVPQYKQLTGRHRQLATEGSISEAGTGSQVGLDMIIEEQANEKRHQAQDATKHTK